ncbi:MAG TPA: ferritin [Cytophagales bacterium]|nr:ferritin [Cytophagales bacterium]HAA23462.1 ferritin [Cytophagales bacterium]HAP60661.1 ferritin [Cytophagales bacterium]
MKDVVRLKTSLQAEIEQMLNDQIAMEAKASSNYLALAAWCSANGYDNSADHFMAQSDEERAHMLKLFNYVMDLGGDVSSPEVTGINHDFDGFRGVFEYALEQEIQVTQSINRIVGKCHELNDYTTAAFLQWFLNEQVEEEWVARRAVELFDIIGEDGIGKFEIDRRIPKISYGGEGEATAE